MTASRKPRWSAFAVVAAIAGSVSLFLPAGMLIHYALFWIGYLLVLTATLVRKHGIVGLFGPTIALAVLAGFHADALVPLCAGAWLAMVALSVCILIGRGGWRSLFGAFRASTRKRDASEFVSIAVPVSARDVNAEDVLARLGFGRN